MLNLGVFGPFQFIILLFLLGLIIVLPIVLTMSRAKLKARSNTHYIVLNRQTTYSEHKFFQTESLTNLSDSGALMHKEFKP